MVISRTYREEGWEKLIDNKIGDVLRLRSHPDRLSTNVHGEHFGGPNPDSSSPGWLVEEYEEE